MKIHQLSLFLENRPGHLSKVIRALAEEGINIITLSLADTEQFGILRLIVRDWVKAKEALDRRGFVATVNEVCAIEVPDRPGGLLELLEDLDSARLNIEYMYAFTYRREDRAIMIFRFENPDAAVQALQAKGVNVIGAVELFDWVKT